MARKGKRKVRKTKSKLDAPTIISLVLGGLGLLGLIGLIALRPQLSVNPQELLAALQPFSAPFEITNNSLLGVHVDNIIVVYHQVEVPGHTTVSITDATSG